MDWRSLWTSRIVAVIFSSDNRSLYFFRSLKVLPNLDLKVFHDEWKKTFHPISC